MYVLRTANMPSLSCQVMPSEGISLEVLFTFNCSRISVSGRRFYYSFYIDPGKYGSRSEGELVNTFQCTC